MLTTYGVYTHDLLQVGVLGGTGLRRWRVAYPPDYKLIDWAWFSAVTLLSLIHYMVAL